VSIGEGQAQAERELAAARDEVARLTHELVAARGELARSGRRDLLTDEQAREVARGLVMQTYGEELAAARAIGFNSAIDAQRAEIADLRERVAAVVKSGALCGRCGAPAARRKKKRA
jgi:hypothetical protein